MKELDVFVLNVAANKSIEGGCLQTVNRSDIVTKDIMLLRRARKFAIIIQGGDNL
jgi:hypothetical protein